MKLILKNHFISWNFNRTNWKLIKWIGYQRRRAFRSVTQAHVPFSISIFISILLSAQQVFSTLMHWAPFGGHRNLFVQEWSVMRVFAHSQLPQVCTPCHPAHYLMRKVPKERRTIRRKTNPGEALILHLCMWSAETGTRVIWHIMHALVFAFIHRCRSCLLLVEVNQEKSCLCA